MGAPWSTTGWTRVSRLELAFWLAYVLAVFALRAAAPPNPRLDDLPVWLQVLVSPLMLPVFWGLLRRFRVAIASALRPLRVVGWLKYMVVGLLLGVGLAVNWTMCFDMCGTDIGRSGVQGADLNPDPWINTLLYVGPFGGILLGWYLLRHIYRFTYWHVFWIEGLRGALTEQGGVLPVSLLAGNIPGALILLVYLIPAYGVVFAPPYLILRAADLPHGMRRPRVGGYLGFVVIPWVLFFLCAALWYAALTAIPHA